MIGRAEIGQLRQGQPVLPQLLADPLLLQAEGEQLLGDDVPGLRRRRDRLDVAAAPGQQQPGREQQLVLVQGQEQAVPRGAGAPSAAAEALQEPRDREAVS